MIVELNEAESSTCNSRWSMREKILAWRAFGKVIGMPVNDPMMVMDGDGIEREPITKRYFYLEQVYPERAEKNKYLSLGYAGCWGGGAITSLWSRCTYISYTTHSDQPVVEFHGWHRPQMKSRLIAPTYEDRALIERYERGDLCNNPYLMKKALTAKALVQRYGGEAPFIGKENLSAMNVLVERMQKLVRTKRRQR